MNKGLYSWIQAFEEVVSGVAKVHTVPYQRKTCLQADRKEVAPAPVYRIIVGTTLSKTFIFLSHLVTFYTCNN